MALDIFTTDCESRAIAAGYKEGFEAFCYYAERRRAKQNRHCSLLLAKKDGCLWYLLKGLSDFRIPVELREDIVVLAFFGNGSKAGKGKRTYPDGSVYEGEFKDGEPHGYGKMVYCDTTIKFMNQAKQHEGEYKKGVPHGQGKVVFYEGGVYEGEFLAKDVCKGTYTNARGGSIIIGDWEITTNPRYPRRIDFVDFE